MSTKRKIWFSVLVIGVLLIGFAVLLIYRNVAIGNPFVGTSNDITVALDKKVVMGADKVVLREGDKTLTITDRKQVRDIAKDFVVANSSGLCGYHNDRWIEIYNGDRLVRQIHWNDHEDLATIENADNIYGARWATVQVKLSKDDAEKYNRLYAKLK